MPASKRSRRAGAIRRNQTRGYRRRRGTVYPELPVLGDSGSSDGEGFGVVFGARYPGRCWLCGYDFGVGDPIRRVRGVSPGGYTHEGCADESVKEAARVADVAGWGTGCAVRARRACYG